MLEREDFPLPVATTGNGLFEDPHHLRGDLRQAETAIRRGWPFPQDVIDRLARQIGDIALGDESKAREKIAAARVLDAMMRTTIMAEGGHISEDVGAKVTIYIPDNGRDVSKESSNEGNAADTPRGGN